MTIREIVTAYIAAIEAHRLDEVAGYLHPDVENREHPNKLLPAGRRHDLAAMREAGERGKAVMASERSRATRDTASSHAELSGDRPKLGRLSAFRTKLAQARSSIRTEIDAMLLRFAVERPADTVYGCPVN
jgi:hypothetical protein